MCCACLLIPVVPPCSTDAFCQTLACLEGLSAVKGCMLERQLHWVSRLFPSLHLPASGDMEAAAGLLRSLWSSLFRDGNSSSHARYLAAFVLQLRTTVFGRMKVPPSVVAAAADVAVRGVKSTRKQDLVRAFALTSPASQLRGHTAGNASLAKRVALPAVSEASAVAMAAAAGVLTDLANSPATTAVAAPSR
ncbi:unnamed protein product [Closterium sp. NIES-54]